MITRVYYKILHTIKHGYYSFAMKGFGAGSRIYSALKIDGIQNIDIGKKVSIQYKTWLAARPLTGESKCCLKIEDGALIGHFNHIYCTGQITIGKNVLTADKVYISDNLHEYEDISLSVLKQPIKQLQPVVIGEGAWLGENVCVIGANVGCGSVIGANSVVTKNIPDYCVAVGAPARVVKKYNHNTKLWEKTS
jgi:acetyltransferase-like isoleucine patch superfamily enzyme